MIFLATFAAVLICSVVSAAIAAPSVAAALAAATAIPVGSMGKWIDSLWKSFEKALKGQKEVISTMQVGTYVAIKDLDNIRVLIDKLEIELETLLKNADLASSINLNQRNIRVLVDKLEIELEALLKNADFAISEEAVKVGIEEIRKKMAAFTKDAEDLGTQANMCSRDIRRARTVVLQRIIKHTNN